MTLQEALTALERKDRQVDELSRSLEAAQKTISALQHQLEELLKRFYGPKSEKYDPDQLLFDRVLLDGAGDPGAQQQGPEPDTPQEPEARTKSKRTPHGRLPIPDHLPREVVVLDVSDEEKTCPVTGEPMICIGEEVSEKLEFRPGRLYVIEYRRPKYVSPQRHNGHTGVLTAPPPDLPIDKCKAGPGLLAHVVVSKFADHLPLYRQEGIFEREGVRIPRSTQDGWVLQLADAIWPIYGALKDAVLESEVLFTDDSVIRLIEPGRGKTRQARMWVYIRAGPGPPMTIFDFTPDRRKERPRQFLGDYRGFIHADAYSGYDELFATDAVTEVGCWSHSRRRFVEAMTSRPREASEIVARIAQLYMIEKQVRGAEPDVLRTTRQQKAIPQLDALFERFGEMLPDTTPAEPLTKAINYALNQREALYRYTEDGRLQIDNNTAENAIRPLAVGRKNWLFAASERGGRANALFLSLVECCRAADVNPWTYFADLFARIMAHPANGLRELLPDQWRPAPGFPS